MNAASRRMLVMVAALALSACAPPYYTSAPIEAWVVDADTGAPIEGAVVTANWQLVAASLDTGGRKLRQLEVMETVSDKDGRFYFPGFTRINFTLDELRDEAPQILIFKPGYRHARTSINYDSSKQAAGTPQLSRLVDSTIRLERSPGDSRTWAADLSSISTSLTSIWDSGDTKSIPRMTHVLHCDAEALLKVDPRTGYLAIPGATSMRTSCERP